MDRALIEKYISAMIRMKNVSMKYPDHMGIQWSELLIMEKICDHHVKEKRYIHVSEIHENMFISKPAVSQALNHLEQKGYIVREIDPGDRRKISVHETRKGKEILNLSEKTYDEKIHYLYDQMGTRDMEKLLKLLNKLADIVDDADK